MLKIDGREVTDDCERAESFNSVFASKFTDPSVDRLPEVTSYEIDALSKFWITYDSDYLYLCLDYL